MRDPDNSSEESVSGGDYQHVFSAIPVGPLIASTAQEAPRPACGQELAHTPRVTAFYRVLPTDLCWTLTIR